MLQQLNQDLEPTQVKSADIISAIVVAVDQIKVFCRQLKYIKNIYLLTNARHKPISDTSSDLDAIRSELLASNINLKVIGIDFDDHVVGLTEPAPKDPVKAANETKLKELVLGMPQPGSIFANAQEAIDTLQLPTAKRVRPVRAFACKLTLGDPTTYQNVLSFDIESFPCVRETSAPSVSTYAVGSTNFDNLTSVNQGLQEVKRVTEYFYTKEEDGDIKEVSLDPADILPGYKFGAEIVVLSEEEQKVLATDQENEQAGMQIIGFVKQSGIKRYGLLGNTNFVVGSKGSLQDSLAVGALAVALAQEQSAAIVRYVTKDAGPVQMGALFPHQVLAEEDEADEPRGWVLVLVSLPFDQDVRRYRFPPLLNRAGGGRAMSEQTEKLLVPTEEMDDAMEQFIDEHDLMAADEGGYEYASPDQVFNPLIHRIKHVVKSCALHDATDVIPPILPSLTKYLEQPPSQKRKRQAKFDQLLGTTPVAAKPSATKKKIVDAAAGGDVNGKGKKVTPRKALDEPINLASLLAGTNVMPTPAQVQIKQESLTDNTRLLGSEEAAEAICDNNDLGHDHNVQLLHTLFAKITTMEKEENISAAAAQTIVANMIKIVKREPNSLRELALELVTTAFSAGDLPDSAVDPMAKLLQTLETM